MVGLRGTGKIDVRAIRTALDITQAQMAALVGVTPDSVYRWEGGRPLSPMARKLICAFAAQPHIRDTLLRNMSREDLARALDLDGGPQAHSA